MSDIESSLALLAKAADEVDAIGADDNQYYRTFLVRDLRRARQALTDLRSGQTDHEEGALVSRKDVLDIVTGCQHDGGFDREIGPIGCDLDGEGRGGCVCRDINMAIRRLDPAHKEISFQTRVNEWMLACFGLEIASDHQERNHRFIEEALELVQACGCTRSEAHQLVDYVYGRDQGDANQEVGGVMVTLAALCTANGFDMDNAGETELTRVWTKIEKIRAKQAAKPKHSPLPIAEDKP